jgi:putative SOS response-associated peptidase YedK
MCGRFAIFSSVPEIKKFADKLKRLEKFNPTYNAVPGSYYPVISKNNFGTVLQEMRWGLVPFWAKDSKIGNKLINARAETISEKPSFKYAYNKRRCLIPVNGFYEWDRQKQPYFAKLKGEDIFFLAGIWEVWQKATNELQTFTILTQKATQPLVNVHHRMPVVLDEHNNRNWLDIRNSIADFSCNPPKLQIYPVSTAVNNPQNDSAELIHAIV